MQLTKGKQLNLALHSLRLAVTVYVSLAVLYTTNFLFAPVLSAALNYEASTTSNTDFLSNLKSYLPSGSLETSVHAAATVNTYDTPFTKHTNDLIYWNSGLAGSTSTSRFDSNRVSTAMPASLFLSKVFSVSQEHLAYADTSNLDIVPYYYRASKSHKKEDITITTLVTRNRFSVFRQLVEIYRGPISVTVHVSRAELAEPSADGSANFLDALHALYSSSPLMAKLVDVHLILTPSRADRQFNAWRNVARLFARTDYIMMLDVDFVPCTDFRKRLLAHKGPVRRLLREGRAALIVPAFEYVEPKDGADARTFPKSKEELISLYNASKIGMFHAAWSAGHSATDYPRFLFNTQPREVYKVAPEHYQHAYEPYVIFRRDGSVPWCDERFVGYGGNKAACLYEMYLSGVDFYVLADDFLVHQSHAYDEQARKLERRYNRRIYADFREEACLRYLTSFRDTGKLGQAIAQNAIEQCKKVKGVARIASMLLEGH